MVCTGVLLVINSTLGSSLPSGASAFLAAYFQVSNQQQLVLPNSMYLVGYVLGPPLFSPLSETYGRKIVLLATFAGFTLFTMACALAPSWPALLVFRFIVGCFASAPISVVGGMYADIYDDPVYRGRAVAVLIGVKPSNPVLDVTYADTISVYHSRARHWPYNFRLCLPNIVEMDILDCSNHCRRIVAASDFRAR